MLFIKVFFIGIGGNVPEKLKTDVLSLKNNYYITCVGASQIIQSLFAVHDLIYPNRKKLDLQNATIDIDNNIISFDTYDDVKKIIVYEQEENANPIVLSNGENSSNENLLFKCKTSLSIPDVYINHLDNDNNYFNKGNFTLKFQDLKKFSKNSNILIEYVENGNYNNFLDTNNNLNNENNENYKNDDNINLNADVNENNDISNKNNLNADKMKTGSNNKGANSTGSNNTAGKNMSSNNTSTSDNNKNFNIINPSQKSTGLFDDDSIKIEGETSAIKVDKYNQYIYNETKKQIELVDETIKTNEIEYADGGGTKYYLGPSGCNRHYLGPRGCNGLSCNRFTNKKNNLVNDDENMSNDILNKNYETTFPFWILLFLLLLGYVVKPRFDKIEHDIQYKINDKIVDEGSLVSIKTYSKFIPYYAERGYTNGINVKACFNKSRIKILKNSLIGDCFIDGEKILTNKNIVLFENSKFVIKTTNENREYIYRYLPSYVKNI